MVEPRAREPLLQLLRASDPSLELQRLEDEEVQRALSRVDPAQEPRLAALIAREALLRQPRSRLERHLAATIEGLDDAIAIETPLGLVTYWNEAAARMFGYSREEMVGRSIETIMLPDHAADIERTRRVGQGERVVDHETQRVRKDGEILDVAVTLSPILDEAGNVEGVAASYRDITQRKASEESTRRNAERYRRLVHESPMSIQTFSPDGRLLEVNAAWEKMWHATQEGLSGYNILRDPLLDELGLMEGVRRAFKGESVELPARRYDPSRVGRTGRARWFKSTIYAMQDDAGHILEVVLMQVDVTDDIEKAEALHEANEDYRLLVESVRDYAIFMLDAEGHVMTWNPGVGRLKGYKADEIIGRHFSIFYPEEARARGVPAAILEDAAQNGDHSEEGWRIRKDGSRFWASVLVTALRDAQGNLRGFSKVTRDLSERRRAEEALRDEERRLRELTKELEARVRERTAALEEALVDMETFTNSASHDLRAPLRGVETLIRALEEDHAPQLDEEGRRLLRAARRENEKAFNLVRALLAFARAGRGQLQREWVDVSEMARELSQEILARHPDRRTNWHVEDGIRMWGDRGLLRIALGNLMSNASKYSNNRPEPLVRIEAADEDGLHGVHVSDNGVGFRPEEAYRLFTAFSRLSSARSFEGTGLGLVAVQRIVTRHGGRVGASSGPEEGGAVFTMLLPAPAASGGPADAPDRPPRS